MKNYNIGDECIIYTPYQPEYHLQRCKITDNTGTAYIITVHGRWGVYAPKEVLIKIGTLEAIVIKRKGTNQT